MKYDFKIMKMIINAIELKSADYNEISMILLERMKIELVKSM